MMTADYTHWRIHAYRNFEKVLKLILLFSCPDKPECVFCEKNSLNYSSLASLAAHYRYSHKTQCVYHYIDEIIKISPQQMEKLYEKNGNSVIMEQIA